MIGIQRKAGGHLRAVAAFTDQTKIGTAANGKAKGVKKNGFAGTCLARQHGQPRFKIQGEAFDQDDIGNAETV